MIDKYKSIDYVKNYQKILNESGIKNIVVDGISGPITRMFINGIQHATKIKEDGIVGPITLSKINNLNNMIDTLHFKRIEFKCKCCGKIEGIPISLLIYLETIRKYYGSNSIIINSGFRCKKHNDYVRGKNNSQHLIGLAADFYIENKNPISVYDFCNKALFKYSGGIGKYNNFTHIDVREKKARW